MDEGKGSYVWSSSDQDLGAPKKSLRKGGTKCRVGGVAGIHHTTSSSHSSNLLSRFIPTGRTIWIADAHREDGKPFVVRADEKLTAFLELESAIYACGESP